MANPEHLEILKQGVEAWNKWRLEHGDVIPDLRGAVLRDADLSDSDADLRVVFLTNANLHGAKLIGANLCAADLRGADLTDASLNFADLRVVNLANANLSGAQLVITNFTGANLRGVDFTDAKMDRTRFVDNDLSEVKGLETVKHLGPSSIGIDTLYKSGGKIPEVFLRGCGVPDDFIAFIPSHFGVQQAIQFYSCFISYSTRDEEFARRLYSRMRDEKLRVWFAPEDIKGGEKLYEG